jgi:hypothetical protein
MQKLNQLNLTIRVLEADLYRGMGMDGLSEKMEDEGDSKAG